MDSPGSLDCFPEDLDIPQVVSGRNWDNVRDWITYVGQLRELYLRYVTEL
jgi:hypothetical protein